MHSVVVISLLAFFWQAHAQELVANASDAHRSMDTSVDNFANKLVDRSLQAKRLHRAELDATTHAKAHVSFRHKLITRTTYTVPRSPLIIPHSRLAVRAPADHCSVFSFSHHCPTSPFESSRFPVPHSLSTSREREPQVGMPGMSASRASAVEEDPVSVAGQGPAEAKRAAKAAAKAAFANMVALRMAV